LEYLFIIGFFIAYLQILLKHKSFSRKR